MAGNGGWNRLLARLQEYAMNSGVRGFVAEILPLNIPMLRLMQRGAGKVTIARDEDAVHATLLFAPDRAAETVEAPGREGGRAVPVQAPI
jgi:hypothetical protein